MIDVTIAKFITATLTFLSKGIDAGINHYKERLKDALNLLEQAKAEIQRVNQINNNYSNELKTERAEKEEIKEDNKKLREENEQLKQHLEK